MCVQYHALNPGLRAAQAGPGLGLYSGANAVMTASASAMAGPGVAAPSCHPSHVMTSESLVKAPLKVGNIAEPRHGRSGTLHVCTGSRTRLAPAASAEGAASTCAGRQSRTLPGHIRRWRTRWDCCGRCGRSDRRYRCGRRTAVTVVGVVVTVLVVIAVTVAIVAAE